jgi:small GTP-binding protein
MSAGKVATKIAVIGQPNVGKTSILNILKQDFEASIAITPTKGVERTITSVLGESLVFWDFGGQEKYKQKYLESPEKYFDNIKYLFFVVDAQNLLTIDKDLDYFNKIYSVAGKYNPTIKITIIFNKVDPELDFVKSLMKECDATMSQFSEIIESEHQLSLSHFYTSKFDYMSIIVAFSEILAEANLRHEVHQILTRLQLDDTRFFETVVIENFIELAHYEKDSNQNTEVQADLKKEIRDIKSKFIQNAWLNLKPSLEQGVLVDDYYIRTFLIDGFKSDYYYVVGIKHASDEIKQNIESRIAELAQKIKAIIKGFS